MKEICLEAYSTDDNPCGFAVMINENLESTVIAMIATNWLMWRI